MPRRIRLAAEALPGLKIIANPLVKASWMLTAADFVNSHQLAQKNGARGILMLGPESGSLEMSALRELGDAVTANSGRPGSSALRFAAASRTGQLRDIVPLEPCVVRFAGRAFRWPSILAFHCEWLNGWQARASALPRRTRRDMPLWPVNEAAVAGFSITEIDAGSRILPHPAEPDLNTILPGLTGSLFADIEAKAAFWQRARQAPQTRNSPPNGQSAQAADAAADIAPMVQAFRLAYSNLLEIWSLVLPPNTLLGLKRLSLADGAAFRMPESLWARIVYDFLLAHRLRTINRGHLLGALIPLYLAWVASHINVVSSGVDPERHIETAAMAFEIEKPYILSRWRWPDRFNP